MDNFELKRLQTPRPRVSGRVNASSCHDSGGQVVCLFWLVFVCSFVVSFFVCLNTYSCQDSEGQVVEKQHSVFKYFQVACGKLFVEKAKREPVLMMGIVGRSFN